MAQVKICGVTTVAAVKAVADAGADFVGFVFYPRSPRHISPNQAQELVTNLSKEVKTVAVCVDITDDELDVMLAHFKPHYLQLHGKESLERVQAIKQKYGIQVIKAIAVRNGDDIARGMAYEKIADMLLFDAKAPETMSSALPGGNGLIFDWNLLKDRVFTVPWILSGGLNAENVKEAVALSGAGIVDVSSSVEVRPGIKDIKLIQEFIRAAKS